MRHKIALVAAVTLLCTSPALALERCGYMTAIPREPKPDDLPDIPDFEGKPWSERPFLPAPERDDLCMDEYIPTGTQIILMEEEIVGDIKIAKLNYKGTAEPEIVVPLMTGSSAMLGPVLRKEGDDWYLVITKRQDYETPQMQVYMLVVAIPGESLRPVVTIQIVNIDDNAPIIQVLDHCVIPEMSATGLTNCIYTVSDLDGEISTRFMKFRIGSDREADGAFYVEGQNIKDEWLWMNMTLGINAPLDFEENPLHIFRVTALDSLPNSHTVTIMVQVENVEHRPPRWVEIFAVQQFDEKTSQQFRVRAIDRDTGVNKSISYYLETEKGDDFFSIETIGDGYQGAMLRVAPIDRDALERDIFRLTIVAHKYDNKELATPANVVIIVNDVNDNSPEPLQDEYCIRIMEETAMTLNFEDEFGFHDRDLGENAQYSVRLESVEPQDAAEAFYIAPTVGYQRQTFIMGTRNHSMLDFENTPYQNITLKVIATDLNRTDFVGMATVRVHLINWNDELPIFERDGLRVSFNETEGAGFLVGTLRARDRDIGDRVEHSLMGNAGQYLRIDMDTGEVRVAVNDSFDYHRQSQLFIQIRADDTLEAPFHTATSQLVIDLIDVNNTPPTLRLPRGSPEVEENVPALITEITREIRATDPDTTAELVFEIDWDTSYATKQGRETNPREYHECVEIRTLYPDPEKKGSAIGSLVVKEIRPNVTIDFEEFEVLYLTIRVRDLNTVLGAEYDELTFTIIVIDLNDNPPVFAPGSLAQPFRVRENSPRGAAVGSVLATDIDGPLYNQIRYTIMPRNNTPADLVEIDFHTGQISVKEDGAIDADTPKRDYLYYTVVASDCCSLPPEECPPDKTCFEPEGEIAIYILDTNNKVPYSEEDKFEQVVYLYENATSGTEVVQLVANDLDRDVIYHTVSYQINYGVNPRLRNFFSVDLDTGSVVVNFTTNEVLDRDGDEPEHRIFIDLFDNFYSAGVGNRNQNSTEVLLVLLDVNDNAPELPSPEALSWSILEDLQEDVRVLPHIYAPDRDEPDTDNSRVGYEIRTLALTDRALTPPALFRMVNIKNVTGELETAMPLRGYWGTYAVTIRAFDHGNPPLCSEEVYQLVIRPYNFHSPVFVFPRDGTTVRLSKERAVPNGVLVTVGGQFLERIAATDEDGLHAGAVTFTVVGDGDGEAYFRVANEGDNQGTLMLKQAFSEQIREFQVVIRGTDGGSEPGPRGTDTALTLVYVPTQGDPEFATSTASVAFTEKEEGLSQRQQLPLAEDPKNYKCDGDCHRIYYHIIESNSEFAVEPTTNVLYLVRELDRNASETHTVRVGASNAPDSASALPASVLTVTVNVREAFPRPYFERALYTAGISTLDTINRELLTVRATHTEDVPITYTIDQSSMVADPTLEAVRDSAFALNPATGLLTLTMQPTAAMHGMFEFDVVATDPDGAKDTSEVKVYLISSQNRVIFRFINTLQEVEDNRDFIAETFSASFRMTCNIDQVVPGSDGSGAALEGVAEVRAHFIQNHVPVPTPVIEQLRSDIPLLRYIQETLNTRLLVLDDLITDISPDPEKNSTKLTVYVLAAIASIFGLLCLVSLVTYFIRTRALKRRLDSLLSTRYGSADEGLQRAGLPAPGTNKHAIEGSNPIWNEAIKAPDFDALSDASDDSDLIGIEDLPQFRADYFPPGDTDSNQYIVNGQDDGVAHSDNHFNFNATPFHPEFANKPYRH